ncbi:IS66-like element accessory protein TnpA [Roseobacter sp.]|uniref:IS66-like element accessory protein TnpA n=1 Tax=Roseobacter sp. TaxID=1907202 RepID=UPI00385828BB
MAKRRRRRNWSDDEKRMICGQTRFPGVSVSQVARRYDVNANQVFNWLKDPEFAAQPDSEDVGRFLPVEIIEPTVPDASATDVSGELQIELAGGHRVTVTGPYDPGTLAALIRKLTT